MCYNVPRIRIEADKKAVVKDYLTTEINNNHNVVVYGVVATLKATKLNINN
jgi:hypothetical protein